MDMIKKDHVTPPSCGHLLLPVVCPCLNDVLELYLFLDFQEILVFLT